MSVPRKVLHYAAVGRRVVVSRFSRALHIDYDIYRQKRALNGYVDDIKSVDMIRTSRTGLFCIFVFFERDGRVSNSVRRIVDALDQAGVNILLVCNHEFSDEQHAFFTPRCHSLMTRGNQGYDFGAYKDAVLYLLDNGFEPDRLILLNDSVFFARRGLPQFVQGLLDGPDVVSAFENWAEDYHLQSFAVGVSGKVFRSDVFGDFWRNYTPVSNRIYSIEMGEKKLSQCLLAAAENSAVLYSVANLYKALVEAPAELRSPEIRVAKQWRTEAVAWVERLRADAERADVASVFSSVVAVTSPIHSGAYFFPKYLGCPIFKKDLVYRQRFDFWEIDHWTQEIMDPEDRAEFGHMLRLKGDANSLAPADRRKYDVGVK